MAVCGHHRLDQLATSNIFAAQKSKAQKSSAPPFVSPNLLWPSALGLWPAISLPLIKFPAAH
jgi:hypothetical protein